MYRIAAEVCCRAVFLACWAGAINLFFFLFASVVTWAEGEVRSWDRCRLLSLQRSSPTDWHLYLKRDTCASTHGLVWPISWCVEGAESFLSVVVCEKAVRTLYSQCCTSHGALIAVLRIDKLYAFFCVVFRYLCILIINTLPFWMHLYGSIV